MLFLYLSAIPQFLLESTVHDLVTIDCNRHREGKFQNKKFIAVDRVHDTFIEEFGNRRKVDQNRKQNLINKRFPSLAEARD